MNKKEMIQRRYGVAGLIRLSNRHRNVLKFSVSEKDAHIDMKLEICKWLKRNGKEFYTEAIFQKGNGRADIINADDQVVYEVYNTETEKSLIRKSHKYPDSLDIIFVDANQSFCEKLLL